MKMRTGFVSNSSSTAFVLDLRNPKVQTWAATVRRAEYQGELWDGSRKLVAVSTPLQGMIEAGLSRSTALSIGPQVLEFAYEYADSYEDLWYGESDEAEDNLGRKVLDLCVEHGAENLVVCRESDEGMGGFFSIPVPREGILLELEMH